MRETKMIGLVGGLGPAATVYYYMGLNDVARRLDLSLRLVVNQAEIDVVLAAAALGDSGALADHLAIRMREQERAGAELLAIAAVTPHLCMDELAGRVSTRVIDLTSLVAADLDRRGIRGAVLMGTRATVTTRMFGRLGHVAIDPSTDQINRVHDLYVGIVERGSADADTITALRASAVEYAEQLGVQEIILAGTELALVPPETWHGMNVLNCAALHIEEIMKVASDRG